MERQRQLAVISLQRPVLEGQPSLLFSCLPTLLLEGSEMLQMITTLHHIHSCDCVVHLVSVALITLVCMPSVEFQVQGIVQPSEGCVQHVFSVPHIVSHNWVTVPSVCSLHTA